MQRRVDPAYLSGTEVDPVSGAATAQINVEQLWAAFRRQARTIVAVMAGATLLALVYSVFATPEYTAATDLLIDSRKDKSELSSNIAELTFDTGAIDSQVEVLKSEKIALSVISSLKLVDDPAFIAGNSSRLTSALKMLRAAFDDITWFVGAERSGAVGPLSLQRVAIDILKYNLVVRRISRTYVLAVQYTSPDPIKAAIIANAYAEAYMHEQLDEKFEATRRASEWLQTRLAELKRQSVSSDLAIQRFKAAHGIVVTGGENPGLISDQQLNELDKQVTVAHGETARAEARHAQIKELLTSARSGIAVPDSLANPVINEIRAKYLASSKMEAQLESKLGPDHLQVIALKREMEEYERLIYDELGRIAESYTSDEAVARAREQSLSRSLTGMVGLSAATDETMVELRGLQREADTYRSLSQSYSERYQEALQQQSFPTSEARVITAATPPVTPSSPKRGLIAVFAMVFGAVVGAGVGALREHGDRVFRVGAQVRDELRLEYLGLLPSVGSIEAVPPRSGSEPKAREIRAAAVLQRYAIDHPLSGFAETLRSAKIAIDLALGQRHGKVVGVISAMPDEGKSTVAKNFASLLSKLGARTLLVDGDLRSPSLTLAMARDVKRGLLEVLRGECAIDDLLLEEPETGLKFLPAVVTKRLVQSSEIMASSAMRNMLTAARTEFDYVIVDLPPLGPVVDVRASASLYDVFVLVVEWGLTPRAVLQNLLVQEATLHERCVGVIYNKVDLRRLRLYENYSSKDYYYGRYSKYIHQWKF